MSKLFVFLIPIVLAGAGCVSGSLEIPQDTVKSDVAVRSASSNSVILSNQNLTSFPMDILDQRSIESLDISENKMTGALPAEIRHLSKLKVLDASNNVFTGIPAEIGQLKNLEVLNFSNNKLTGLPYELGNLSRLRVLDLSGNNVSEVDLAIILENLSPDLELRL